MSVKSGSSPLAIDGGDPVRPTFRSWPAWPSPAPGAERLLVEALHSGRWAITGRRGSELFERRFAREFAAYNDVEHCVPVDHGSSALVVALESLGLDYGDTVLVPALTWTASATAALRAGLLPVLIDVSPATGCIGPDNLDLEANPRAIVAVHWACAMADVPALCDAVADRDTSVVEDCAQAHGARWHGRAAGTMGRLGCFSMQNSKVLTAGEGGAVITNDSSLAAVLEELRADSRRYVADKDHPRGSELHETASVMGANFCLSEFNSAVLCAQLAVLDEQHDVRNSNYRRLAELFSDIPGVRLLMPAEQQTKMAIYEGTVIFDELPGGLPAARLAEILTAELGLPIYPVDTPLHRSPLLRPWTKPALAALAERFVEYHRGRIYPNTEYFAEHTVQMHHSALLGDERDVRDIADAIAKVVRWPRAT